MGAVLHVRAFQDNYIWLIAADDRRLIAVDPGDAEPVLAFLEARDYRLAAIFCTHHHGDHCAGIEDLIARAPVPVFGPADEAVAGVTHRVREGDVVEVPGFDAFRVLDVPGHTAGHIAYASNDALFCGDTLFSAGCGRLFEGTAAQLHHSLQKLAALPKSTRVYCGHEYTAANLAFARVVEPDNPRRDVYSEEVRARRARGEPSLPSTIGLEREVNPFLRVHLPALRAAAARTDPKVGSAPSDVFAIVRRQKDGFKG